MSAVKAVCVFREGKEMPAWVAPTIEAAGIEFAERDCKTTEQALELARDADIVWIMGGGASDKCGRSAATRALWCHRPQRQWHR